MVTEYNWTHGDQNNNYVSLSQRTVGLSSQRDMSGSDVYNFWVISPGNVGGPEMGLSW